MPNVATFGVSDSIQPSMANFDAAKWAAGHGRVEAAYHQGMAAGKTPNLD